MGAGQGRIVGIRLDYVGGKISDTWQHAGPADAEAVIIARSSFASCTQWMKGRELFEHVGKVIEESRKLTRRRTPFVFPSWLSLTYSELPEESCAQYLDDGMEWSVICRSPIREKGGCKRLCTFKCFIEQLLL